MQNEKGKTIPRPEDFKFPVKGGPLVKKEKAKLWSKLTDAIYSECKIRPVNFGGKEVKPIGFISTGFQPLDDALSGKRSKKHPTRTIPGTGKGLPKGRMVEIAGIEGSAKTSLALAVIAQAQREGGLAVFIDAEHALDEEYAKNVMGVNLDNEHWLLYEPDYGEQALSMLQNSVEMGATVVVLDSIAAVVPKKELEGNEGLGQQARLMSQACRRITAKMQRNGTCVIFINQFREKIGLVFGPSRVTAGGKAVGFYSSVRVEMNVEKKLKKQSETKGKPVVIGQRVELHTIKNKVATPHGRATFDIIYGKGIRIPKAEKKDKKEQKDKE